MRDKKVLNLYVRSNVPFDRSTVESESVSQIDSQTYRITMECSYSLFVSTEEDSNQKISESLQKDISNEICVIDPRTHLPLVLGTAEIPIEDIQNLVSQHQDNIEKTLERVVFIYGTAIAERDGIIIGKMKLFLKYQTEEVNEEDQPKDAEFMGIMWQQERVTNREIPVNCRLMINIFNIDGIDDKRIGYTTKTLAGLTLPTPENLNLSVRYNPIGEIIYPEDSNIEGLNEYITPVIYSSAEPIFKTKWYIDFSVDQRVLSFLEQGSATFEVRHSTCDFSVEDTFGPRSSQAKKEEAYLVGTARVPLIRLLSSHSGIINEAVEITDRCNHCFGYLRLSINLLDASEEIHPDSESFPRKSEMFSEKKRLIGQSSPIQKTSPKQMPKEETKKIIETYPTADLEITVESGLRLHNPFDCI